MLKKDTSFKKIHVKTGDKVVVLCGRDRNQRGKVLAVSPKEAKVIVSGIGMVSKHAKPRRAGEEGGIIRTESAIYSCKVQLVCGRCDSPTRIAHKFAEDGKKLRMCKKCGEII
ncbi:MAG: 50S ribosomal protein L24 [Oscillospiraceae bacterium]|nr:50S ribosomal protein L24 [Oscillospiraceae bacterium]